jgi:hypothetical protein
VLPHEHGGGDEDEGAEEAPADSLLTGVVKVMAHQVTSRDLSMHLIWLGTPERLRNIIQAW